MKNLAKLIALVTCLAWAFEENAWAARMSRGKAIKLAKTTRETKRLTQGIERITNKQVLKGKVDEINSLMTQLKKDKNNSIQAEAVVEAAQKAILAQQQKIRQAELAKQRREEAERERVRIARELEERRRAEEEERRIAEEKRSIAEEIRKLAADLRECEQIFQGLEHDKEETEQYFKEVEENLSFLK